MNSINQKIASLSPEKRALLELKLKNKKNNKYLNTPQYEEIPKRSNHDSVPLSFAQQRLWFLDQLETNNPFYKTSGAFLLQGNLNLQVLQQALSEIVRRHEVLRTSFQTVNGTPIQVIHPEATTNINVVNLQQHSEKERQTLLQQLVQQEAITPFDLEIAPFIRCSLLQLDATEYVLLLTMHHIISDAWSIGVLIQEVSSLYQAFCAGEPSPLPELPIQYADFAVWQRQWLSGLVLETELNYWQEHLAGAPEFLQLPTDRPRPSVQTYRGATQSFTLNTDLTQKLQTLSRKSNSTLFMTLQAAFATLLYRYSGQSDILIGSPIANRNRTEIESSIGFFVNTLVLRTHFEDNPSFESLLAQVRKTTLKAYEHQDVPFEKVVEALQPQRYLSHSPLFQVMFVLQNAPIGKVELPSVTLSKLDIENTTAKFDLTLLIAETDQRLVGQWEYNTDLFDGSTIEQMAGHFQNLLSAIVENPQQKVSELPLLIAAERHQLLTEWNDTAKEYPTDKCIHQLFEQQVENTPDAIAVVFEKEQLTYRQLNQRANQLAHHLQGLAVGPEVLVGICVERSIEMVVGLLGILKAGGAYVPLDPNYPQERLNYMLADSGVEVLLTQQSLLESLPQKHAQVVCLDTDGETIEQHSQENLDVGICSDNLAYTIYTSGSTGRPKGVLVEHKNVVRLFAATKFWYHFNANDVWTNFHSIAFDFSVWEIWGALFFGGRLVIVPYCISRDPQSFYELLCSNNVTVLNQTPSAFRQLIRVEKEAGDQLALRAVIFGGEALELQSLRPWIESYGDQSPRLINMYGITETTVHVTYRPIELKDIAENCGSVIGTPIPDLSLYILDEQFEPVPLGVPGEMYVGGIGVSRNYLNQPQITAQRFVPHPFSEKPGARLYRTGDLARRLRNGDLEYLGRSDQQVKVRGFRIELGEIEAALAAIPQVSEAVAIAYSQNEDDKRLVGYVVPNGAPPESSDLRASLKESLPDYMIPAAFVFLDEMPLTAQGKVDRKALPTPDWSHGVAKGILVLPQSAAEKIICQVWQKVLGIDAVGVEDNYFELGGDSILALQVVTEMRRQGWEMKVKDIFAEQRVKELALVVKRLESIASISEKVGGETSLVPIQKWFFDLNIPNPNHWNQAVLLEVNQSLDVQVIQKAIKTVSLHHDIFRLRFQQQADGWRQFYTENDWSFAWESIDLSAQSQQEQNITMQSHWDRLQQSLDLSQGPLAGAILFQLGGKRPHRLLIVIHHLIIDGVSWRILLEDLGDAIKGKSLTLPTSSFQHWSNFLQSFTHSRSIQQEQKFWLAMIKDTQFQLPLDFGDRSSNLESSVKTIALEFTEADTNNFLTQAHKAYRTSPEELLVAALSQTISNWAGNEVIQVMMEAHGREELTNDVQLSHTLGWFTALYPLRLDLSLCNDHQTLLTRVKEQMRAVPRRGLGYGLLRYLQNRETTDELTLACVGDISCNYLGQVRGDNWQGNDLFRLLQNEDTGLLHDPNGLRPHLLDIIAIVVNGKLQVNWLYSSHLHRQETINKWTQGFQQNLLAILAHCTEPGVGGYTPSDFPLIHIEQSSLSHLEAKFPNLEDIYPLSPMQEGMLFHTVYSSEDGVYFEQGIGRITGLKDVAAFNLAWQTLVERHPVLRSAFVWSGQKQAVQIVNKSVEFGIIEYDWRDLSPQLQEDELNRYLTTTRKQGFVLDQAPLMSFAIMRLDDNTWQWVWNHHHILVDGWSLPILFKEVLIIYQSILQGVSPSLAPVTPYRHYIQWLVSQDEQQTQQFWRENLAGIDKPTRLLSSFLKDAEVIENQRPYDKADLHLSEKEFASLQKMVQKQRLTLNTLAQGAWALILHKYGAGEDVLFGVTVSGRPPELGDIENMVGLFINTLPLRVRFNPTLTVTDWLQEIQQRHLQMREYEHSKLTHIHQTIGFPAGEPLFESILVFENYPIDQSLKTQGDDLQVDNIQFYERTNYPLTIAFLPDNGLVLRLNYETKFLSAAAAKTMLQRLKHLLLQLAENPHSHLGVIELLSTTEKQEAIALGNGPKIGWGDFQGAHQIFEERVELNPDATALVFEDESITYKELEQRANLLASQLRERGISYESVVGLYLNSSINFIVGMLGVLKAGAAFLPLDPNYPPERLKWISQDCQVELFISDRETKGFFQVDADKVINLAEIDWNRQVTRLNLPIFASHLAYLIYTSGSTGKPKGVMVTHAGVQNLVRSQTEAFEVTAASRIYQFASVSFDAAISEIFMALGAGATLYMKNKAYRSPSPALWQALTAWKITHITLPPSLLAAIKPEDLPELKTTIIAGEAASGNLLERWSKEKDCRIFNAYGPTEATVCASLVDCSDLVGEPSIGRAIFNVEMYLLDSNLEPVTVGVPGQIYIGGIALARGYWNRPDLTAAAFIPHPFSTEAGERLYCTGDMGVSDHFGNIRFLGRQDNLVKLRGHRIELREIEAALLGYEKVDSAVVLLREDLPGKPQLVAYALPRVETTTSKVLTHLSEILPSYMVPSTVVFVEEWPLTPNGKIDRKALKCPELPAVKPATFNSQTEQILAQIWAEVLGKEAVHPEDNFFEIGGDSIISLQIVSHAREAGLEIDPRDIFETKTLSRLAEVARSLSKQVVISEPVTGKVPLAPIQRWFFERNLPHPHHWNQPLALEAKEPLDLAALQVALANAIAHHDIFRLQFVWNGKVWQQSYSVPAAKPPLRVEDFALCPFDRQAELLEKTVAEEQTLFSLDRPPLLRLLYAKNLQEYGNVLYLLAHHLIVDVVSWRILGEDFERAYKSALLGEPVSLPPRTSSYRQWTTSLEKLANSPEIAADISFWQEQISHSHSTLPVDRQIRGKNTVDSLAIASVQMSGNRTRALLTEATTNYRATIQEILLASLLVTITQWNGCDNLLIDLESHGREDLGSKLDLSRTVGWFTSLYPVLLRGTKNTNQEQLLKQVKEQMRAIPHSGQSYGMLRYLSSDPSVREKLCGQKAQISFNYLGQIDSTQKNSKFFQLSNAPTVAGMFARQELPHLLAVNAFIQNESLQVNWYYSHNIYRSETIEDLALNYLDRLGFYLESVNCSSDSYSVSDFSLVELSDSELNSILENLDN
ncbi:non-ribosomal peptide synthetase [Nostoc sp. 'Peltigera membranacea cyanobiont' 232]|uniref:non-ribosomal peptide synthetase n=1 Tax=Nostoc sp. 'Peltigera membranacea cyanobiont' 232 TaxID=2014531 RepID=UPI000B9582F3|nr:non-ribosomal peptide synthetase [Nostoc sp. 'Peltigera membranacea cyanobiont' 232]OYE04337.1 non-ribosomal peptide synthetase [Nostoc sp. 'Peltigera membranacea cyanobiont' 232]